MQTDIPLKALTAACAPDLLPLLGVPEAEVLGVESLELPATATAVDSLLRPRARAGLPYLHLLEWQGYRDPSFLWRVMGYLAWLGLNRSERPIAATVIYLHRDDDVGGHLEQAVAGQVSWAFTVTQVRLWEQDAVAAVGSGRLGLAVLSPLMRGATAELVEQAAALVLAQAAPPRRQADLLTILGVFAAPLMAPELFLRLIGRERLMASDLISYLFADKVAEWEAERERLEQERQAERERLEQERQAEREQLERALVQTVQDTVLARFPATPPALLAGLGELHDAGRLQALHHAVLYAADQDSVEGLLREITPAAEH